MENFLDRERAQVWAVDRATGEPRYVANGQADALREKARRDWRCPFPGCLTVISTRGGSRRDHFWHPSGSAHASDGESEAHLGAKAMLTTWATSQCPSGAAAIEEETVSLKEPETALHRRADVMVTWEDSARTAFEVEYKNFLVRDWQHKQDDYDRESVACVWLLGHTRLRHRRTITTGNGIELASVHLPPLAMAWVDAGRFVLVVNPVTRQIGTVAGDCAFTRRPNRYADHAWVRLDDLGDCELHRQYGIITPTMKAILSAEDDERRRADEEAEAQRRRMDESAHVRRQEEAPRAARRTSTGPLRSPSEIEAQRLRRERADDWMHHPFRRICLAQWGKIPAVVAEELGSDLGIAASHEHWHSLVFAYFIDTQPVGSTFSIRDILKRLEQHQMPLHESPPLRFPAIQGFIRHLADHGYVSIGAEVTGHIHGDITVLRTLTTSPR